MIKKDQIRIRIYTFSLIFFIVDILSKAILLKNGNLIFRNEIIPNFFYIDYATNTGGAFSIFQNYTFLIIIVSIILLFYIDHKMIKEDNSKTLNIGLSLIIGGALGNLFDRIVKGEVIDFLSFIIFGYHFPIFNFADVFICVGTFLMVLDIIRGEISENRSKKQ